VDLYLDPTRIPGVVGGQGKSHRAEGARRVRASAPRWIHARGTVAVSWMKVTTTEKMRDQNRRCGGIMFGGEKSRSVVHLCEPAALEWYPRTGH
jgi:hypothetical protein